MRPSGPAWSALTSSTSSPITFPFSLSLLPTSCFCHGAFAVVIFPSPSFNPYSYFRQASNPQGSHHQPSLVKAFFLGYHSNTNTFLCLARLQLQCDTYMPDNLVSNSLVQWDKSTWRGGTTFERASPTPSPPST